LLLQAELGPLDEATAMRFDAYLSLLLRWNARINLTAIRDVEGILSRHFVESIACARMLPEGIATLLDVGSGAGFPGIPIALCRPEIAVTLAESQGKKASFLREAIRTLGLSAVVHAGRAEMIAGCFDCATLRAVDRMREAVEIAATLVAGTGWLVLLATRREVAGLRDAAGPEFRWDREFAVPFSSERIVALGRRSEAQAIL
jgi:16S rRNA (guanine527-N7)-methyltransferase